MGENVEKLIWLQFREEFHSNRIGLPWKAVFLDLS